MHRLRRRTGQVVPGAAVALAILAATIGIALIGEGAASLFLNEAAELRQGDEFRFDVVVMSEAHGLNHIERNALTIRVGTLGVFDVPGIGIVNTVPIYIERITPEWEGDAQCGVVCTSDPAARSQVRTRTETVVHYSAADGAPVGLELDAEADQWYFDQGRPHRANQQIHVSSARPDLQGAGLGNETLTSRIHAVDVTVHLISFLAGEPLGNILKATERTQYGGVTLTLAQRTSESWGIQGQTGCDAPGLLGSYWDSAESAGDGTLNHDVSTEVWVHPDVPVPYIMLCQADFHDDNDGLVEQVEYGIFLTDHRPGRGPTLRPQYVWETVSEAEGFPLLAQSEVFIRGAPADTDVPRLFPLHDALRAAESHQPARERGLVTRDGPDYALQLGRYHQSSAGPGKAVNAIAPLPVDLSEVSNGAELKATWNLHLIDSQGQMHRVEMERRYAADGSMSERVTDYVPPDHSTVPENPLPWPNRLTTLDALNTHASSQTGMSRTAFDPEMEWDMTIENQLYRSHEGTPFRVAHQARIAMSSQTDESGQGEWILYDLERGYAYAHGETTATQSEAPYAPPRATPLDDSPTELRGNVTEHVQIQSLPAGVLLASVAATGLMTIMLVRTSWRRQYGA